MLEQRFPRTLLGQRRSRREDGLEIAVFGHEVASGFLANALYPRDIVGGVPHHREIVGDSIGEHAKSLLSVLDGNPGLLHSCWSAPARIEQPDARTDELLEVLVARYDDDIHALLHPLAGERADHVVGLVALQRQHRDAVRIEQLGDALHARIEVALKLLCQLFPGGLVGRIPFVPKAQSGIMNPAEVFGLVRGRQALDEIGDTPGGRCVLPSGRRQRA